MKISKNIIWLIFFFVTFLFYYSAYHLPFKFNQLPGDGICNITYWYSLFNPILRGSTCAATTKPGWAIVLGICHEFYSFFNQSDLLLKLVLTFFAASLVWIITRISTETGGRTAGIFSFLFALSDPTIFNWYKGALSYLFFLPFLMFGLWLYSKGKERTGVLLLIISIFFRIESVLVVLFICVFEIFRCNYRRSLLIGIVLGMAVLLWFGFIYIVQNSLARWDCGNAAGYNILDKENNFLNIYSSTKYYLESWQEYFKMIKYELFLIPFSLFSVFSFSNLRIYVAIIGIFLVYFLNIILLGGTNQVACIMILHPFNLSLGIGGFFYFLVKIEKNENIQKKFRRFFVVLGTVVIIGYMINSGMFKNFGIFFNKEKPSSIGALTDNPFIVNALDIINRNLIPKESRVLTEDDIIYSLIVNSPRHYFGKMFAFPYFNICDEKKREEMLTYTDFIYISKLNHVTFFLIPSYLVNWKNDAFRKNIINLLRSGQSFSMYNVIFRLIEKSEYGFLINVENKKN